MRLILSLMELLDTEAAELPSISETNIGQAIQNRTS